MRFVRKPVIGRLHVIAPPEPARVVGEAPHVRPPADMLDDRVRVNQIEHATMKQLWIRRVAFDRHEGPGVLDGKGLRIDHCDADPAPIGVEKRLGDPPIGFRPA